MPTQDELLAGLLGGIPGGPLTQGLLATSAGLLSAGGPSYEPRSLGGALGAGMMSGLNAYQAAQQNALSQYVGATKLMQQMRQQQALNDLTQGMTPQQRALVLANPDAATGAMAKAVWLCFSPIMCGSGPDNSSVVDRISICCAMLRIG